MTRFAYFGSRIVPIEDAKVSVMTHALNYGTAVFGGIRGYWNEEEGQLYVFRPLDHFKRFLQSASLLRMELGHTPQSLTDIVTELHCRYGPLMRDSGAERDAFSQEM